MVKHDLMMYVDKTTHYYTSMQFIFLQKLILKSMILIIKLIMFCFCIYFIFKYSLYKEMYMYMPFLFWEMWKSLKLFNNNLIYPDWKSMWFMSKQSWHLTKSMSMCMWVSSMIPILMMTLMGMIVMMKTCIPMMMYLFFSYMQLLQMIDLMEWIKHFLITLMYTILYSYSLFWFKSLVFHSVGGTVEVLIFFLKHEYKTLKKHWW